jgi:hypothetical protein
LRTVTTKTRTPAANRFLFDRWHWTLGMKVSQLFSIDLNYFKTGPDRVHDMPMN